MKIFHPYGTLDLSFGDVENVEIYPKADLCRYTLSVFLADGSKLVLNFPDKVIANDVFDELNTLIDRR